MFLLFFSKIWLKFSLTFTHTEKWNTSKVSIIELIAAIRISLECALLDPETQLHGVKVIFDTEGLSMSQIAQNTPKHACMILDWVQKACPFRLRGVHVVNNSMLFNILFAIFKPFVSKELREKVSFAEQTNRYKKKC